nr:NADH dehydrogenase subunit 2 [Phyllozelus siccus siccus]
MTMWYPAKYLFSLTLGLGILITLSSSSWFGAWLGLEINLMSFIPLLTSPKKSPLKTEAALTYFLVQALGSSIILFAFTMNKLVSISSLTLNSLFLNIILIALFLKMGAAPLHFWLPGTMDGSTWTNCFILMTLQKIAPLLLTSYLIELNPLTGAVIISSMIVGAIGGLNQTSLRKLLAYSSINHAGWMMGSMLLTDDLWMIYFLIYSLLNYTIIVHLNQLNVFYSPQAFLYYKYDASLKVVAYCLFLSLGGLPPFLGFMPKWLVIHTLIMSNHTFLALVLVMATLITLFYYIRLLIPGFMFVYQFSPWIPRDIIPQNSTKLIPTAMVVGLLGIPAPLYFWLSW